jgi:hypothetical protein
MYMVFRHFCVYSSILEVEVEVEVEVTLRLTVNQSVSMSWYRVPLWDLRPDIMPEWKRWLLGRRVSELSPIRHNRAVFSDWLRP